MSRGKPNPYFMKKWIKFAFLSAESNWTLCGNSSAGQLEEKISPCPAALPAPERSSWGLSAVLLIRNTDSSPSPHPPAHSSHCFSAACNMHRFSLSLPPPLCSQRTQGQRWQSLHCCSKPDQHGNCLISVKLVCMLSSASQIEIWPRRPIRHRGDEKKRKKIKWNHYFYLIQRLQCDTAIPSACGRRTPIHSRNPVFVPSVCCPPLPVPCPLSKERQHSKHPLLLFCRASWHPSSCLGWWR